MYNCSYVYLTEWLKNHIVDCSKSKCVSINIKHNDKMIMRSENDCPCLHVQCIVHPICLPICQTCQIMIYKMLTDALYVWFEQKA